MLRFSAVKLNDINEETSNSTMNPITKKQTNNKFLHNNSSSRFNKNNPRIVPVSRDFGGKDRHSKVCTVRGLRDRRIRLSVPTAVQLYDLQDRLGLNQPSKVIDWLLDVAKNDITNLPPLPIIPAGLISNVDQQNNFGVQNFFPLANIDRQFPMMPTLLPSNLSLTQFGNSIPLSSSQMYPPSFFHPFSSFNPSSSNMDV